MRPSQPEQQVATTPVKAYYILISIQSNVKAGEWCLINNCSLRSTSSAIEIYLTAPWERGWVGMVA
jgi:hypothetical protein